MQAASTAALGRSLLARRARWAAAAGRGRGGARAMASKGGTLPVSERHAGGHTFFLDSFAERQWAADYAGTCMRSTDRQELLGRLEDAVRARGDGVLREGYAPFCKHVFIENLDEEVKPGAVRITDANTALLRCGYEARASHELPVLGRWFEGQPGGGGARARFLDVILYSREQILQETAATGAGGAAPPEGVPWGIIRCGPCCPCRSAPDSFDSFEGGC